MAQFLGTVQLGGFYNNGTILKRPTKPWRPDNDPGGAGGGLRRDGGVNPHGMRKPGRGGESRPPGASKNPLLYSGRSPSWGRSAQVSGLGFTSKNGAIFSHLSCPLFSKISSRYRKHV